MEFKDILVHVDDTPQCAARLKLAARLAARHDAFLTGLYVITHQHYAPSYTGAGKMAAAAEELFAKQTAGLGKTEWVAVDWPVTGTTPAEVICRYAHKKDLVIVGQGDPENQAELEAELAERVVMGAGRPVLVVPYAGRFEEIGERVLLAWKDGRASARALADSIPLLQRAEKVSVITINAGDKAPGAPLPDSEIAPHLERHGIRLVQETVETGEMTVANALMLYAWENGCDLLVMGAYAHAARGSIAVGPVAKELFEQMTVPVLMSH